MAKKSPSSTLAPAVYKSGQTDHNALLRLALLEAWKFRCYQCTVPLTFSEAQIDHIIPASLSAPELLQLKRAYLTAGASSRFDLNRPHNLAPICRQCNTNKSNRTFLGVPALAVWLQKAQEKEADVQSFVHGVRTGSSLQKSITILLEADLLTETSQRSLGKLGPALIERLRLDAADVFTAPSAHFYGGRFSQADRSGRYHRTLADGPIVTSTTLDEDGRRALVVLGEVYLSDPDELFDAGLEQVVAQLESDLKAKISARAGDGDHLVSEVGPVSSSISFTILGLKFERKDGAFSLTGRFEIDGSAHVAFVDYQNDSGTRWDEVHSDTERGEFTVEVTCSTSCCSCSSDPHVDGFEADEAVLTWG